MNIAALIRAARKVTADNKKFKKLSKAEKRVAVAKDAIAQLLTGGYQASPGTYVRIGDKLGLESVFGQSIPQCNVCGIGAALLSEFRLSGGCDALKEGYSNDTRNYYYTQGDDSKVFGGKTLRAMEHAFEREGRFGACGASGCTVCVADTLAFVENHEARLYAILKNIIDNGGRFKAKRVPEDVAARDRAIEAGRKIETEYAKLKVKALEYVQRDAA